MRFVVTGVLAALALAAPLAASAQRGPNVQLTAAEGRFEQISPHVFMLEAWPNAGVVVGTTGVLVVDTGLGRDNGAVLAREAARRAAGGKKVYLVTTHYHPEHAGGQNAFPPPVTVIRARVQQEELLKDGPGAVKNFASRSPEFAAFLAPAQDTRADIVFDKDYRLDLGGGVIVRLANFGGGHTMGDTVIMVDPDAVLFSGDLVESLFSPNMNCATCSPRQWIAALDAIAAMGPKIVVPTHGPAPVDASYVGRSRAFLTDVMTRANALKAEGKPPEEAGKIVQAEMATKYPTWTNLQNLTTSVSRAYANP